MKTAIITGAARGIGLATAKCFLSEGWRVSLVDRDSGALLDNAKPLGEAALPIIADISEPQQVEEMIQQTLDWSQRIDCLVNNAGVADFKSVEATDFEIWRTIMATNLDGAFLCSNAALAALKETNGSIVHIGSISGLRGSTLRIAYGTSKAALMHMTKQQAAELGEFGIRVNCIAPGPVRTKLAMQVHTQDIIDAYHDAIPLNRYGEEMEIAEAIYFLASDKASYITGQTLAADGGFDAVGVGLPALRKKT